MITAGKWATRDQRNHQSGRWAHIVKTKPVTPRLHQSLGTRSHGVGPFLQRLSTQNRPGRQLLGTLVQLRHDPDTHPPRSDLPRWTLRSAEPVSRTRMPRPRQREARLLDGVPGGIGPSRHQEAPAGRGGCGSFRMAAGFELGSTEFPVEFTRSVAAGSITFLGEPERMNNIEQPLF